MSCVSYLNKAKEIYQSFEVLWTLTVTTALCGQYICMALVYVTDLGLQCNLRYVVVQSLYSVAVQ